MFVKVVFPIPVNSYYYYILPEKFIEKISIGMRVRVNLNNRDTFGFVIDKIKKIDDKISPKGLKAVIDLADIQPLINQQIINLAVWVSSYYCASIGECLKLMAPGGFKPKVFNFDKDWRETKEIILTAEQLKITDELKKLDPPDYALIYGVTGSGKTEIYLSLMEYFIQKKKQVIYLVPEISLTEQLISKIISRFNKERVAVIHSSLKQGEKLYFWQRIINNEIDIVVGARSAVFAPFNNLGLIIVDEENDTSYKSSQTPRYNARQVAYVRAEKEKALLILGSATPSVETYYFALKNKYKLFLLNERYNKNPLPQFHVIDLKESDDFNKKYPLTKTLIEKIRNNLDKKQQVILFLNRRGFSNYILCPDCGTVFQCDKCNISYTYHKTDNMLLCHYCGGKKRFPYACEKCGSKNLIQSGAGTQKIEQILKEIFSDKNISRLDIDVSRKKGKLKEIITDFEKDNINILTGTQIISKGLNFPNVTLVGILFIDEILNLPDFRASENVFDLIIQVSGRAGREKIRGEVVIQTFIPEHFSIKYASNYQFSEFYKKELELRKELNYPPFCRLVKITIEGKDVILVKNTSQTVFSLLKSNIKEESVQLLGPVTSPLSKIKNKFRYQILIKTKRINHIREALNRIERRYKTVNIVIDVDPISLL